MRYETSAELSDPNSLGEDLLRSVALVFDIAKQHCNDCGGYHLRYVVGRTVRTEASVNYDRIELIARLETELKSIAAHRNGGLEILIPGSADTGLLATCAHTAQRLGPEVSRRTKFTVLDICRTPLLLCQAFAERHGISLKVDQVDLNYPRGEHAADVIVVHSLLRYLHPENHVKFLAALARWLRPGGKIILSNRLQEGLSNKRKSHIAGLMQKVSAGELTLPVDVCEIIEALREPPDPPATLERAEDLRQLIAEAGLQIDAEDIVDKERRPEDILLAPELSRAVRYVAVLSRPD